MGEMQMVILENEMKKFLTILKKKWLKKLNRKIILETKHF